MANILIFSFGGTDTLMLKYYSLWIWFLAWVGGGKRGLTMTPGPYLSGMLRGLMHDKQGPAGLSACMEDNRGKLITSQYSLSLINIGIHEKKFVSLNSKYLYKLETTKKNWKNCKEEETSKMYCKNYAKCILLHQCSKRALGCKARKKPWVQYA